MPNMKGGQLIAEYLVQEKVPYVFGICGHGNVGILDALYDVKRPHQARVAAPRAVRRPHGRRVLPRASHRPVATLTSTGPGLGEPGDVAGHGAVGLVRVPGHHVQRADLAAQPRAVPGAVQAQPGGLRAGDAPGRQARVPADARRHAAAGAAAGDGHDGHGPPGSGEPRHPVQRVPGRGRRRVARALAPRHGRIVPVASDADVAAALDLLAAAQQPVLFIGQGATLSEAGPGDHRARAPAGHSGHHLAERHGLHRRRRSAGARLHRPQRRLPGQRGGAARRPRADDRHALRRPVGVELASRLLVEFPEDEADARRHRPAGAGPQLPAHARHHRRREGVHAPAAGQRCRSGATSTRRATTPGGDEVVAGRRSGRRSSGRTSATRRARCGRSSSSARCRRCCPTT